MVGRAWIVRKTTKLHHLTSNLYFYVHQILWVFTSDWWLKGSSRTLFTLLVGVDAVAILVVPVKLWVVVDDYITAQVITVELLQENLRLADENFNKLFDNEPGWRDAGSQEFASSHRTLRELQSRKRKTMVAGIWWLHNLDNSSGIHVWLEARLSVECRSCSKFFLPISATKIVRKMENYQKYSTCLFLQCLKFDLNRFFLVFASFVLEPNSNNARWQSCHIHKLFLDKSIGSIVHIVSTS